VWRGLQSYYDIWKIETFGKNSHHMPEICPMFIFNAHSSSLHSELPGNFSGVVWQKKSVR